MSYHLRDRVRREVERSLWQSSIIDVRQLADRMSQEIDGESSTATIMLERLIIDECAHKRIGMRIGGRSVEAAD